MPRGRRLRHALSEGSKSREVESSNTSRCDSAANAQFRESEGRNRGTGAGSHAKKKREGDGTFSFYGSLLDTFEFLYTSSLFDESYRNCSVLG